MIDNISSANIPKISIHLVIELIIHLWFQRRSKNQNDANDSNTEMEIAKEPVIDTAPSTVRTVVSFQISGPVESCTYFTKDNQPGKQKLKGE